MIDQYPSFKYLLASVFRSIRFFFFNTLCQKFYDKKDADRGKRLASLRWCRGCVVMLLVFANEFNDGMIIVPLCHGMCVHHLLVGFAVF